VVFRNEWQRERAIAVLSHRSDPHIASETLLAFVDGEAAVVLSRVPVPERRGGWARACQFVDGIQDGDAFAADE
jgi:hypothetical protein